MKEKLEKVEECVYLGAISAFSFLGLVGVLLNYESYIYLASAGGLLGGIAGFVLWKKAASGRHSVS